MIGGLYDLLENLIIAQYESEKLKLLIPLNSRLQILRYQTRLLRDFDLISVQRYEYVGGLMNEIGKELGGWIKQQQRREKNS